MKKGDTRRLKQVSYVTLHMYRDEAMYMYECREYAPGLGLAIKSLYVSMCLCRQSELVYKYNCTNVKCTLLAYC